MRTYDESLALVGRTLYGLPIEGPLVEIPSVILLILLTGRERLRRRFDSDLERFGEVYAHGDSEIQAQLIDISMTIRTDIFSSLQSSCSDDTHLNYAALESELREKEDLAISCLECYSHRLSEAAAAAKDSKGTARVISIPMQSDRAPETLANSNDWSSSGSKITEDLDSFSTAQFRQIPEEYSSPTIPKMPTVVEEAEYGRLSDIDVDRFSTLSLTSSTSGYASFRSLGQRIKTGGASYIKEFRG